MGKRGPRPLPSAVKRRRGTFQRCRESAAEPHGEPGLPPRPKGLNPAERAEWKSLGKLLIGMGVLHQGHGDALLLLVKSKCRYLRLDAKVAEMGEVLEEDGRLRRNPYAIAMERALIEYRRLCGEFGITPSSATRVLADRATDAAASGPQIAPFGVLSNTRKAQ